MNKYQSNYWNELVKLKHHIYYLEAYSEGTEKVDRNIKMFLAFMSNGSIATWAIWQDLSLLWGGLIALSQLINTIKNFLPYKIQYKATYSLLNEFNELFLYSEMNWFNVSEGKLDQEEIHKLYMGIKKKKNNLEAKYFKSILPEKSKYKKVADHKVESYYK